MPTDPSNFAHHKYLFRIYCMNSENHSITCQYSSDCSSVENSTSPIAKKIKMTFIAKNFYDVIHLISKKFSHTGSHYLNNLCACTILLSFIYCQMKYLYCHGTQYQSLPNWWINTCGSINIYGSIWMNKHIWRKYFSYLCLTQGVVCRPSHCSPLFRQVLRSCLHTFPTFIYTYKYLHVHISLDWNMYS